MSFETESILDRRRLRRKLGTWRALAVVAVVGALAIAGYYLSASQKLLSPNQIARIEVTGLITDNRKQLQLLKKIRSSDNVKGLLVYINSPGGTTTGAEALFNSIRQIAEKKPVVAQFGTVAASAAYITGLATDHIVARGNTITGSVGVIMQWPEFTGLLDKVGIKMNEVKSGNLKAEPSPFKPETPESRAISQEMIANGQEWFLGLVKSRRKITTSTVPGLEEGRVFLGRTALKHKLIDEIGGEEQAVNWLITKHKLEPNLQVIDWKPSQNNIWLGGNAMAQFLGYFGIGQGIADAARRQLEMSSLDGLIAVWQPHKN